MYNKIYWLSRKKVDINSKIWTMIDIVLQQKKWSIEVINAFPSFHWVPTMTATCTGYCWHLGAWLLSILLPPSPGKRAWPESLHSSTSSTPCGLLWSTSQYVVIENLNCKCQKDTYGVFSLSPFDEVKRICGCPCHHPPWPIPSTTLRENHIGYSWQ